MTTFDIFDFLGLMGASLILFGFYRISIGRWSNKSFWYELDNVVGPVLLIIYQLHLKAYISVVVNAIWAVVAFRGLTSFADRYRHRKKKKERRSVR